MQNITRLLNIGGDEPTRQLRSQLLRGNGYEVIDLPTGDRATDVARRLKPVLILVPTLPGIDTAGIISRLKLDSGTSKIPVVAVADATTNEEDQVAVLNNGAEVCLRDPPPGVLLAAVSAVLRSAQIQTELRTALKHERIARHELAAAKRAIVESETLYREMSESFRYGVWMSDPSGTLIFISDSFLALTETTLEKARAGEWRKRIAAEDVAAYQDSWLRSLQTREPWEHEYRVLGPDGEYHHVLSRGRPIFKDSGEMLGWAGMNLDVADRKRQEQQILRLASAEEIRRRQFEAMLNSVTEALVLLDVESQTIIMNPAGQRLHGFSPGEIPLTPSLLKNTLEVRTGDGSLVAFEQWPLMRAARGDTISDVLDRQSRGSPCYRRVR